MKLDIENAQNAVIKASLLETMDSEPSLQHLSLHAASVLAMPSALETGGLVWGEQGNGFTQGEAESSGNYAVATQPELRELDEELAMAGGCARAGNDDAYLLGPPEAVFPALEKYAKKLKKQCGLSLQRHKTEVFCWEICRCRPHPTSGGLVSELVKSLPRDLKCTALG